MSDAAQFFGPPSAAHDRTLTLYFVFPPLSLTDTISISPTTSIESDMADQAEIIIDEGDLRTFLKEPSKGNGSSNDSRGSRGSLESGDINDRRSQMQSFGDSFSSIKDFLSVGSISEDLALEDDHNATFSKSDKSENDPANVQALIDSYFAKLESKRDSTGKDPESTAAAVAGAVESITAQDVKEIDDLNQVESYFDRIDSRTKLDGAGRRKVRSRRKKSSANNDDLMDKFLAMKVKKDGSSSKSLSKSGGSDKAFGFSTE